MAKLRSELSKIVIKSLSEKKKQNAQLNMMNETQIILDFEQVNQHLHQAKNSPR